MARRSTSSSPGTGTALIPSAPSIRGVLLRIGNEIIPGSTPMRKIEAIMRRVYQLAAEGEPWAVHFIADRTEGKAVDRIEQTVRSSGPPQIVYQVVTAARPVLPVLPEGPSVN